MTNPFINFALRGFQALFGIIVLGLSVSLIKHHHWGGLPAQLGFVAAVGGLTVLTAIIGFAASFVSALEGSLGVLIDGIVALINIAGGIIMAIKINAVKCDWTEHGDKFLANTMFNGGCDGKCGVDPERNTSSIWTLVYLGGQKSVNYMLSRCKESQADSVFMFLAAVLLIVSAFLGFLRMKKGY